MDFSQPHRVLLFFEKGEQWLSATRAIYLAAQWEYYTQLKSEGKVYDCGYPGHGEGLLVGVNIDNDTELHHILAGDPALKGKVLELVNAYPYF
ncbi:hypothetical protein [Chitinophaga sp.]|uniref:hypothetical protein n=1 Tax=Chitinophaga sp. TaxID=1869181 RepID=UPI0031D1EC5C